MSETQRERATHLMNAALQTADGISVELLPQEILNIRSLCYAIREQDRIFNNGKSKYNRLTFSIDYPGPKLLIRLKHGALPLRDGTTEANKEHSRTE